MAGQILRCPTKKDKNVWRIRWDGPRDQFGKRKRLHETVRGTNKEAQAILDSAYSWSTADHKLIEVMPPLLN